MCGGISTRITYLFRNEKRLPNVLPDSNSCRAIQRNVGRVGKVGMLVIRQTGAILVEIRGSMMITCVEYRSP